MKKLAAIFFLTLFTFTLNASASIEVPVVSPECHAYATNAANNETGFWAKLFGNGEWEVNYDYYYGLCENNNGESELLDPIVL